MTAGINVGSGDARFLINLHDRINRFPSVVQRSAASAQNLGRDQN
jgi:hypothetical protein